VGLARCGTVFPVSAVVGAAVPAAVCRWGLARAVLMWGGVSRSGVNIIIIIAEGRLLLVCFVRVFGCQLCGGSCVVCVVRVTCVLF